MSGACVALLELSNTHLARFRWLSEGHDPSAAAAAPTQKELDHLALSPAARNNFGLGDGDEETRQAQSEIRAVIDTVSKHPGAAPFAMAALVQGIAQFNIGIGCASGGREGRASVMLARLGLLVDALETVMRFLSCQDAEALTPFIATTLPSWIKRVLEEELRQTERCSRGVRRDRVFLLLVALRSLLGGPATAEHRSEVLGVVATDSCQTFFQLWIMLQALQPPPHVCCAPGTATATLYAADREVRDREVRGQHQPSGSVSGVAPEELGDQQKHLLALMRTIAHPRGTCWRGQTQTQTQAQQPRVEYVGSGLGSAEPLVEMFVVYFNALSAAAVSPEERWVPEMVAQTAVWATWSAATVAGLTTPVSRAVTTLSRHSCDSFGPLLRRVRTRARSDRTTSDRWAGVSGHVQSMLQLYLCSCGNKASLLRLVLVQTKALNRYCNQIADELGATAESGSAPAQAELQTPLEARAGDTVVLLLVLAALGAHIAEEVLDERRVARLLVRICGKCAWWEASVPDSPARRPLLRFLVAAATNAVLYILLHRLALLPADSLEEEEEEVVNDGVEVEVEEDEVSPRKLALAVLPLLAACFVDDALASSATSERVHPILLYYAELYVLPGVVRAVPGAAAARLPAGPERCAVLKRMLLQEASASSGSTGTGADSAMARAMAVLNLRALAAGLPAGGVGAPAALRGLCLQEWPRGDTPAGARPNIHGYLQRAAGGCTELAGTIGGMLALHRENQALGLGAARGRRAGRQPLLYGDVLRHILSFCNYRQLCSYSRVSRGFHELCNQTGQWRAIYLARFGRLRSEDSVLPRVGGPRKKVTGLKAVEVTLFLEDLGEEDGRHRFMQYHSFSYDSNAGSRLATAGAARSQAGAVTGAASVPLGGASSADTASTPGAAGGSANSNALPPVCTECIVRNERGVENVDSAARHWVVCRSPNRQHDWKRLFRDRYLLLKRVHRQRRAQGLVDRLGRPVTVCCVVGCGAVFWSPHIERHMMTHVAVLERDRELARVEKKKRKRSSKS